MSDINNLVNAIKDVDNNSIIYVLNIISNCDPKLKVELLTDEDLKNKLKNAIFDYSKNDYWQGFRRVLDFLSPKELLSLYAMEDIKKHFNGDIRFREYILFAACLEKNITETINYALKNNDIFDEMFKLAEYYYSVFANIDYESLKSVIYKMQDMNISYSFSFISSVPASMQTEILKEKFETKYLINIIDNCRIDVISDFFLNDNRALYLYDKINLKLYIKNGVKFNRNIIAQNEFWELLKDDSLINYRSYINALEKSSYTEIIDKKVKEYYEEMLSSYDSESNMFSCYVDLLENPIKVDKRDYKKSYLINDEVVYQLRSHLSYEDNVLIYKSADKLRENLMKITSYKLTEIIVDYLFKDNFYNVRLNINEMLRFNSKLDDKVLNEEKEKLYKTILNFDNIPNNKKMEIYNKLKDKKVDEFYYDDLRKLKDISYVLINRDLFNLDELKVYPDEKLTEDNGVEVYDLRDKEYTMLIRGQSNYRNVSSNRRNCYSVISNFNTNHYGSSDGLIYYGYNSFDKDIVVHALEQDSFSADLKDDSPSNYVNRLMTSEELVRNNTWYSEFDLVNRKNENGSYNVKRPDFVVCFNEIKQKDIFAAEKLNIPIVLIKERRLSHEELLDIPFDSEKDKYIDSGFLESKQRNAR